MRFWQPPFIPIIANGIQCIAEACPSQRKDIRYICFIGIYTGSQMILRLARLVDHPYPLSLKPAGQLYASASLVEHLGRKIF